MTLEQAMNILKRFKGDVIAVGDGKVFLVSRKIFLVIYDVETGDLKDFIFDAFEERRLEILKDGKITKQFKGYCLKHEGWIYQVGKNFLRGYNSAPRNLMPNVLESGE
ncbi:MAG: hypothetical protein M0Z75_10075 [Nitrospiraceae bacterium]|nr:hypothetical protein [Nitrospiraceae bacterium]